MAGELVLVIGGVRSGKSDYALRLASSRTGRVTVLATGEASDAEMRRRIDLHRRGRPKAWTTVEAPRDIGSPLRAAGPHDVLLLDDIGNLVTAHLREVVGDVDPEAIEAPPGADEKLDQGVRRDLEDLTSMVDNGDVGIVIAVANEVGMGVVPPTVLGRLFRDAMGRANQLLAQRATSVVFCMAGIPTIVKGDDPMKARG